ncbi:MAG: hypothetical protein Q8L48_22925 [Archangium sp.]|nr:hypothetical protein [Archangium sp.]
MRRLAVLLLALAGCTNPLVDDVPRLYACDRAEGLNSCPGGWRCGLSGFCQDPAQNLPYACESAADCSTTWHCGAERLCYDRAAAQDRSCRASQEAIADAGDCAPGWRCGREVRGQVCHALDAGAAYLCVTDSDCEATWRCGPEGACVDVAKQGLHLGQVSVTAVKVSPLLPAQVELVQVDVKQRTAFETNRAAFIAAGSVTLATNGSSTMQDPTSLTSTPLLRPAHALALTAAHLLATDAMGLVDYGGALDGGTASLLVPSLANAELRYAPALTSPVSVDEELASFSGASVGLCERGLDMITCDPREFRFATLPSAVSDVAFLDDAFKRRSALAATAAGPYFAPRRGPFIALDGGDSAAPEWRPVALPGLSDACAATPVPLDRVFYDAASRLLTATSDQDQRLSVFKHAPGEQPTSPCAALAFTPQYGPCPACGPGEQLLKVGSGGASTNDLAVTLCLRAEVDAGSSTVGYRHATPMDGGCGLEPLSLPAGVRQGYHVARDSAGLAGLDATGTPRGCPQAGCLSMLSSGLPDRVAGGPSLLTTHNDDLFDGAQYSPQPSGVSSTLGLRPVTFGTLYVAGSVTGKPDWMIGSQGRTGTLGDQSMVVQSMSRKLGDLNADPPPLAVLSRSSDLLPSAFGMMLIDGSGTRAFSTITTDADGQPWLIVGAGDRLWADDRLISEDAGIRTIGIKSVPLPSADIQSLAFAASDRGDAGTGPLLDGYTVEQQRIFRVVVHTPSLWLSDEIRLGVTNAVPLSVWMEGSRGRVGTSDGRVFGLPVPVPLSPTIPEAPLPTVVAFGSLCGQAFALSPTALYRLSLETPPLGTWKRVPLESAHPGLDAFPPHWGPVTHQARVGREEHLYLFSQTGLVIDLKATCP